MYVPWSLVSFEVVGRENVPGIPGACANRNFMYLVRGPWGTSGYKWIQVSKPRDSDLNFPNRYRDECQISERYEHLNISYLGFETSRDLPERRLTVFGARSTSTHQQPTHNCDIMLALFENPFRVQQIRCCKMTPWRKNVSRITGPLWEYFYSRRTYNRDVFFVASRNNLSNNRLVGDLRRHQYWLLKAINDLTVQL